MVLQNFLHGWLLQCLYTKSNHIFFKESKPTSFILLLSLKFSLVICGSLLMFSYCLIQRTCPDFQGVEWVRHSENEVTGLCSRLSPQPGSGTAHTPQLQPFICLYWGPDVRWIPFLHLAPSSGSCWHPPKEQLSEMVSKGQQGQQGQQVCSGVMWTV